jgi:hypothetical protein
MLLYIFFKKPKIKILLPPSTLKPSETTNSSSSITTTTTTSSASSSSASLHSLTSFPITKPPSVFSGGKKTATDSANNKNDVKINEKNKIDDV